MRYVKKIICLLMVMFMVAGIFGSIKVDAKEITIATPKVSIKLLSKKTGVKITIGKTKDADGYVVSISGTPANSEYCDSFKYKDSDDDTIFFMGTGNIFRIYEDGKSKRSITYKSLQPGTYTVKVRSWNSKKFGTEIYSEWSKEKTFTLKESATTGYSTSYDFSKVKKGDVIKFGAYEQDLNYTNGKEPIEWIVLKKTKKSILLLSKYALDRLPYNKGYTDVTWGNCTLRKWLNNAFIESAFNKTEQGMIKATTIENYDNAVYKTVGGNDTKDKVFLLSQLEMINSDYGFKENYGDSDINRRCMFAWCKNKDSSGPKFDEYNCWWWLRSPGGATNFACYVSTAGSVSCNGKVVDYVGGSHGYDLYTPSSDLFNYAGVRPAMWIKIKS